MGRTSIPSRLICASLTFFCCAVGFGAEEVPLLRWQTDYVQAHRIRVERHKPMLVFLTMDGCPHCHRMLETTYKDKLIIHEIAASYVPIVINGTHQRELASRFGVRVYPTTFVVGADNRILDRMEGYVTPREMQRRLDDVAHLEELQAQLPDAGEPKAR
jgi:thioredoxin-related protein